MRAIDLFCGAGGLSLGVKNAGYDVAFAIDWDETACQTHAANFPKCVTEKRDVRTVTGKEIKDRFGHIDLLAGGPNCQGVSQRGLRDPDDPRNMMLREFLRLVEEVQPPRFLMENVAGLAHKQNLPLLRELFMRFADMGYGCGADVLLAADYGVPQLRHRMFLAGDRGLRDVAFPEPTHAKKHRTVRDAIGDMPLECDGRNDHTTTALAAVNRARIAAVPPGGNWKDLPAELLPPRFWRYRMTDQNGTYARLRWDRPAYTITCRSGNVTCGAFTHPEADRALSVREAARIQTFPDDFRFVGNVSDRYRQIGNAVPPLLAEAVARVAGNPFAQGVEPRITGTVLCDERKWKKLVLTPRADSYGEGTRWPKAWGPEDESKLNGNYGLREEFWPDNART